jgi:hypothetical protein
MGSKLVRGRDARVTGHILSQSLFFTHRNRLDQIIGMPSLRILVFIVLIMLQAVGDVSSVSADTSACLVTKANGNPPPGLQPSALFYGNGALWTVLWPDRTVVFRPGGSGFALPDGSLEN